jgi:DNA-binding transcriptional regulator YiaG
MAKKWQDLIDKMSKKRQTRIQRGADRILQEITLQELRKARELTQQDVAASLNVNQAAISKMEGQADMRISTLRKLLSTMGGQLKLVAEFPDCEVAIDGIGDVIGVIRSRGGQARRSGKAFTAALQEKGRKHK